MQMRLTHGLRKTDWVEHLVSDPAIRSNTSVCLKLSDAAVAGLDDEAQAAIPKAMVKLLEHEGTAFDLGAYRDAPAGLRIWCGATVETSNIEALTPWLDWAFGEASA